jgi:hypothetical protein
MFSLEDFVRESNRIEGIADASPTEIGAHEAFLTRPVTVKSLIELVAVLQPNACSATAPASPASASATIRSGVRSGDQDEPRRDPAQPEHLGSAHPV